MDLTQEQIDAEFTRQVHLCSGLGRERMLAIVEAHFPPAHDWQFYANGTFCRKCGATIGSGVACSSRGWRE